MLLVKLGIRKGTLLNRFTFGLMAAGSALALAACSAESGNQNTQDSTDEEATPSQAEIESQESEERAAMSPEDFNERILSLDDLPGGFTLEDEVEFGETEEQADTPFDADDSSSKADSTQTECIVGTMKTHSSDLNGVSAARNFDNSNDSAGTFIMTSLSRPEKGAKEMLKDLRKTVDECQRTIDAQPAESVDIFEPSGNKGEGFCTTAYDGSFIGQGKIVMSECYVAWAGELMTIHNMAFEAGVASQVDRDAVQGVTDHMTDDLLPKALKKADMAKS